LEKKRKKGNFLLMTYEFERDSNGFEGNSNRGIEGKMKREFSFYEFMTQRIREGFEGVRENYSYRIEGDFCYEFVISKLLGGQLKPNSRTWALSYKQSKCMQLFVSELDSG
jgi:hypothetical protein